MAASKDIAGLNFDEFEYYTVNGVEVTITKLRADLDDPSIETGIRVYGAAFTDANRFPHMRDKVLFGSDAATAIANLFNDII